MLLEKWKGSLRKALKAKSSEFTNVLALLQKQRMPWSRMGSEVKQSFPGSYSELDSESYY
mgnify:CR=1 FL=1